MPTQVIFVTGTDTGVGKTLLTSLLARHLRQSGGSVAALKPIASGSRDDARRLLAATGGVLTLDEINPWHFRLPLAPVLAARREGRRVMKQQVLSLVCSVSQRFEVVIVEGAGGLLSPLGEDFDSRDLLLALAAQPLIVAPNCLGVINQVLLVLDALPKPLARRAEIVLMQPRRCDQAARTNPALLSEMLDGRQIQCLPWLGESPRWDHALRQTRVRRTLNSLANGLV